MSKMADQDQDELQKLAVSLAASGHNVFITGQAGTGKTTTLLKIAEKLKETKLIAVTASTGIAAHRFSNGMTLHRWSGIGDGRHSNDELLHLLQNDDRFSDAKTRLRTTDVLIIDEISMISKKALGQVEYVCRKLRNSKFYFGGIQMIISGDLYQLPPVPNVMYGDAGKYCIETLFFDAVFPHKLNLTKVYRQDEAELIKAINELERGVPSEDTNCFIRSLERDINVPTCEQNFESKTKLFARNVDVLMYNDSELEKFPGNSFVYKSQDSGDRYYLKKIIAPPVLAVKQKCPVLLIRNLDGNLVNGLQGVVEKFDEDAIYVTFNTNGDKTYSKIERCTFTIFDPVEKCNIATRIQFPLQLAFGLSIHKSQGMSIKYLEIDCAKATNPGQIGVALGRGISSRHISVKHYKSTLCTHHPKLITSFYDTCSLGEIKQTLECCHISVPDVDTDTSVHEHEPTCEDSDSDIDEDEKAIIFLLLELGEERGITAPTLLDECIRLSLEDFLGTPEESNAKQAVHLLKQCENTLSWFKDMENDMRNIFNTCVSSTKEKIQGKKFTEFYTRFQELLSSETYITSVNELCNSSNLPEKMGKMLTTSIMFTLQKIILKESCVDVQTTSSSSVNIKQIPTKLGDSARGKIRYIAGYTIAKCKYRLTEKAKKKLFIPSLTEEKKTIMRQIKILETLTISASEIARESELKETLEETERKQNLREGLTNVTDETMIFFEKLEAIMREKITMASLNLHKKLLFITILKELLSDVHLYELFLSLFCGHIEMQQLQGREEMDVSIQDICGYLVDSVCDYEVLFEMTVNLFVKVSASQFRRDYLTSLKVSKTKALRKKVMEKSKMKEAQKPIDMTFILNDQSTNKEISHHKLKSEALLNKQFYLKFKKDDLIQLIQMYGETVRKSLKKCEIGERLVDILCRESTVGMSHHTGLPTQQHLEPVPSTSTSCVETSEQKKKGKSSRKRNKTQKEKKSDEKGNYPKDKITLCFVCEQSIIAQDLIFCDSCQNPYHRDCVGLVDDHDWNYYTSPDNLFTCLDCM